ncbi:hypothetical protein Tco_1561771 [Tanacetum coccineum]
MPTTRFGMTLDAIEQLIRQYVAEALAAREANSNNGNENRNEVENHNEVNGGIGGVAPVVKACLARWFENMESVFRINNCAIDLQVKFATCTLVDSALTWWNSHVQTIGIDEAYVMSWKDLMKLMIKVYCPRNEI